MLELPTAIPSKLEMENLDEVSYLVQKSWA